MKIKIAPYMVREHHYTWERARSSARLERPADNREVGGSNPPGPTNSTAKTLGKRKALVHCSFGLSGGCITLFVTTFIS